MSFLRIANVIGNNLPKMYTVIRYRHTCRNPLKVSIVGAAGGVGRHLGMLLKLHPEVISLNLHDISPEVIGVAADISDIDTNAMVTAYCGEESLLQAVACCELVVITAGDSHQKGMEEHEDLLENNGPLIQHIVKTIVKGNAKTRPFIHIVTNPINALVPLAAKVLQDLNHYDERKLSGSTSIDAMRARAFLGTHVSSDPEKITISVIGGHSPKSITPIISQSMPDFDLSTEDKLKIMRRVIWGYKDVFEAKEKKGTAQLSVAYAVARFCYSLIDAIRGKKGSEMAYIPTKICGDVPFMATQFSLDANGVENVSQLPKMEEAEEKQFESAIEDIKENIQMAEELAEENEQEDCK